MYENKYILIGFIVVVVVYFMIKSYKKKEHMTNTPVNNAEAIANVASLYNIGNFTVTNSNVTNKLTTKDLESTNKITAKDLESTNLSKLKDIEVGGTVRTNAIRLDKGTITRGIEPDQIDTNDLGLYSNVEANALRFVTKNGQTVFYADGNKGTNPLMIINPNGHINIRAGASLCIGNTCINENHLKGLVGINDIQVRPINELGRCFDFGSQGRTECSNLWSRVKFNVL